MELKRAVARLNTVKRKIHRVVEDAEIDQMTFCIIPTGLVQLLGLNKILFHCCMYLAYL